MLIFDFIFVFNFKPFGWLKSLTVKCCTVKLDVEAQERTMSQV